jgi:hypothetical protein
MLTTSETEIKMKSILAIIVLALLTAGVASAKEINPADYVLSAQIMGYSMGEGGGSSPIMNAKTGAVSGYALDFGGPGHAEIKIGSTVYTVIGRWPKIKNDIGSSFPAYMEKNHIYILVPDKNGKVQNLSFRITGQHIA